jgi:hypothetical protein
MSKLIYGVGINDANYKVRQRNSFCPYYSTWYGMIKRCYSEIALKKKPAYAGCSVCDEWLTFTSFRNWMLEQDWNGKHLDKDIIKPGNKVYSPDTCCFVTVAVNNLILTNPKSRGKYAIGVHYDKRRRRYQASIKVNGKNTNIGRYTTEAEAAKAYREAKRELLLKAAKSQSDPRVKFALEKRAELI